MWMIIVFGLFAVVLLTALAYGLFCLGQIAYQRLTPLVTSLPSTGGVMSVMSEKSEKGLTTMVDSLTMRAVLIGILAMVMLVPLALVGEIVYERGNRYKSVLNDIARTWGGTQTVIGPVLVVPFTEVKTIQQTLTESDGTSRTIDKIVRTEQVARFLPDELLINVRITDEVRERGIFKSLVYAAELDVVATIDALEITSLSNRIETIHWDKASVSVGLSDTRAIKEVSLFEWNGQSNVLSPGTKLSELSSGFHGALPELEPPGFAHCKSSDECRGLWCFQFYAIRGVYQRKHGVDMAPSEFSGRRSA